MRLLLRFSVFLLSLIALANPLRAQTPAPAIPPKLKVATKIVAPFVMEQDKRLTGFSTELWAGIAKQLEVESSYSMHGSVNDLLNAVGTKQADVGIAAISITAQRDKSFDFSQPIYDAGLQILVRDEDSRNGSPDFISMIFTRQLAQLIGIIFVLALIPAHIIYFIERRAKNGFLENTSYLSGIGKSMWWAAATLATQAEEMPKSPMGRFIAVIWMFSSVIFVAYFTATVTTSLTVQQLRGAINGPQDLPGKKVATIKGSTSEQYLDERHIRSTEYPGIDKACAALQAKQVDAVVFDAPVLQYYAAHEGEGKATVVGTVFRKESYGIVFRNGSPLRKPVNNSLLQLKENGTYDHLMNKWFNAADGK